jgi:hypothetical protein
MDRSVGMCGLVCTDCEAYKATQANDMDWLQRIVEQWKVEYGAQNLTVEGVACDGCVTGSARKCGHCSECDIRLCGLEKGVVNCGECADYESCERIQNFFKYVPTAKVLLDEVHAAR